MSIDQPNTQDKIFTFYSQTGEDLFVFLNLINQSREDGSYLELGAWDGYVYSNTKFFQDELMFKGTLIEPIPATYDRLLHNRPLDKCIHAAVSCDEGTVDFMGNEPTAGMCDTMSDHMRKHNHKNSTKYKVNARKLSSILQENNTEYLDMFFLDVEGGEYEVLKSMDWDIPVYFVCIELDNTNEEKDENCRKLLKEKGFSFMQRLCSNEFWVNKDYYRKQLLFRNKDAQFNFTSPFMEPQHTQEILSLCTTKSK